MTTTIVVAVLLSAFSFIPHDAATPSETPIPELLYTELELAISDVILANPQASRDTIIARGKKVPIVIFNDGDPCEMIVVPAIFARDQEDGIYLLEAVFTEVYMNRWKLEVNDKAFYQEEAQRHPVFSSVFVVRGRIWRCGDDEDPDTSTPDP